MRKAVRLFLIIPIFVLILILSGALMNAQAATADPQTTAQTNPPTVAEAEQFMRDAETRLNDLTVKASRASWVQSNFITDDTEQMAADANEVLIGVTTELGEAGHALRQPEAARRAGAQDAAAEALGGRACARA